MSVEAQAGYLRRIAKNSNMEFRNIICSGAAHGDNDYRKIFPNSKILFVDMISGEGVDYTWNLEEDPPKELEQSCDLFISTSVLEHVKRPWLAAKNIVKTISRKGCIFITVPWAWEYHSFPEDYWRMSPDALNVLFEGTKAIDTLWVTHPDGNGYKNKEDIPATTDSRIQGVSHKGFDFDVRIHPLVQVFQLRCISD